MESLAGHVLIATPGLVDPNFYRTVVLVVEHNDQGAMGLVLNRPMHLTVDAVWTQVGDGKCRLDGPVGQGGPVEGPIMVLHPHEQAGQVRVCHGVCFTTESERVTWIIEEADGPARVFLGYAGWSAGQLDSEIASGGWLTMPADASMVFGAGDTDGDGDGEALWKRVMNRASRRRMNTKIFPDDPSVN